MGIAVQIIGTLAMFAGFVVGVFGFTQVGLGGFLFLPYGIGIFITGMTFVCLGLLVEHVHGLRKAQERTNAILLERLGSPVQ